MTNSQIDNLIQLVLIISTIIISLSIAFFIIRKNILNYEKNAKDEINKIFDETEKKIKARRGISIAMIIGFIAALFTKDQQNNNSDNVQS